MSFDAFVALVNYFPNITALQLHMFTLEPDEGPVPTLSHPLRGKVSFHDVQVDWVEFFDRFAKLDLEYEELVISSYSIFSGRRPLKSVLQTSATTIKSLRLATELQCE